ncbi:ectoderm-neural cortex protein 1-like isoform X2 [Rhodnius prolixus]|uniref:ectoderm-neural cortex protein 1-like isoform X2 n=1 Tax=Rhodnius prolixus TaxID=13249 RepID=UPI003D18BE0B
MCMLSSRNVKEKVMCELRDEKSSSNESDKVKMSKEVKKFENVGFIHEPTITAIDERSVDTTPVPSKELTSVGFGNSEEFSDTSVEHEEEKKEVCVNVKSGGNNQTLNSLDLFNENGDSQVKTGLDKLIPYHLFNCINPDILIRINDVEFGVHRPLLKLYTSYFEDAIADLDECIVTLPESKVSMETFQAIYSWMLHESEEATKCIDRKNIANIYVAAKYLNLEDLIKTCRIILESRDLFNEMTAFSLFMEAYNLGDRETQGMMLPRIQSVFLHIVSSSLFVNLPVDIILMLLSSDYIKVHSELDVFYSAVKWLLFDWPARGFNSSRVMQVVRFALLRPSQLIDLKRCPDCPMIKMITNARDILKLIDDGIALSVKLETHGSIPELLNEECNKLGLNLPSPRCWFEDSMIHQSYEEFLQSLEIIKKQHHYS